MNEKITFREIFETVKKALLVNGIFLLLMSVFRVIFFIHYADFPALKGLGGYVIKAFILGMRFDLAVIAYFNVLVTLTLLIVWAIHSRKVFDVWLTALKYYYFIAFSVIVFVLTVDFGFYSYFKSHINIIIFGVIEDDTFALMKTIAQNRYSLPAVAVLIAVEVFIYYICHKTGKSIKKAVSVPGAGYPAFAKVLFVFLLLVGNFLAARGSLKMFPLGTMDASISPNDFINKLGINGFYPLGEAIEGRISEAEGSLDYINMTGYEGRPEQAFSFFLGKKVSGNDMISALGRVTPANKAAERIRPNVILLVMEGFGADLLNYNGPDFNVLGELKRHYDSDYVFRNFLSADIGTIGSLESIFINIPKRPQSKPVTQSRYAFTAYSSGAALPFKKSGYQTIFVYGGDIGWRNLSAFVPLQGFDIADGEGAMPRDALKNEWGVYDQYLFDYIYNRLTADNGKPKFIMAMSTGNHPPYSVPDDYKKLPLNISGLLDKRITGDRQLAVKRFATYQYANQKLGELITKIKASGFGKNTIIVVTGDHNFWDVFDYGTERLFDRFSVPLYMYVPDALKPAKADTSVFGSHIDIMPTLYNLALSRAEYVAIGRDLFNPGANHEAFNSQSFLASKEGAASCNLPKDSASYYAWDSSNERKIIPAAETQEMKERVDYYKAAIAVTDYYIKNFKR
jgi:phosphoglycerol transferase MdoB-like AlkP superfamily enzyme